MTTGDGARDEEEDEMLAQRRVRLLSSATAMTSGERYKSAKRRVSIEDLPMEVLQDVFARCVERSGSAIPTTPRLASVSRTFRDAINSAPEMFWVDIDMSSGFCAPTDAKIKTMCSTGRWRGARSVDFSGCGKLTDTTLRVIAAECPHISELKFSGGKFTKAGLEQLARRGGFQSITMDLTNPKLTPSDALFVLRAFIVHSSDTLERVSCGRTAPYSPAERRAFTNASTQLFNDLKKCANLKILDFTNCGEDVRFPLYELQRYCPHVEELRLNYFGGDPGWTIVGHAPVDFEDTCWRKLRVCEVAVAMETTSVGYRLGRSNINDAGLISILYGSIETLEVLDVTGCSNLGNWSSVVWDTLPTNLIELRCARTPLASDEAVRHVLAHLCPSLQHLELSCVAAAATHVTDDAFTPHFAPGSGPPLALQTLRLAGSAVSERALRVLCDARFPHLRAIDLSACRALSRTIRRIAVDAFPRDNIRALQRALVVVVHTREQR